MVTHLHSKSVALSQTDKVLKEWKPFHTTRGRLLKDPPQALRSCHEAKKNRPAGEKVPKLDCSR